MHLHLESVLKTLRERKKNKSNKHNDSNKTITFCMLYWNKRNKGQRLALTTPKVITQMGLLQWRHKNLLKVITPAQKNLLTAVWQLKICQNKNCNTARRCSVCVCVCVEGACLPKAEECRLWIAGTNSMAAWLHSSASSLFFLEEPTWVLPHAEIKDR